MCVRGPEGVEGTFNYALFNRHIKVEHTAKSCDEPFESSFKVFDTNSLALLITQQVLSRNDVCIVGPRLYA